MDYPTPLYGSSPLPSPSCSKRLLVYVPLSSDQLLQLLPMRENTKLAVLSFCTWLILLTKISISSSIHVPKSNGWHVSFAACIQHFILSSMHGYLAWFHTLPIADSAAINMDIQISLYNTYFNFLEHTHSGIVGLYANSILNFCEEAVFQ